jgi:translation initiation factor IF-3
MSVPAALALAREKELDLVEIAPKAVPPVCKIISWSKFKYEYSKKKKGTKAPSSQMKEMWFKPLIDEGDLAHKVKRVREFLDDKNKVKLTVRSSRQTSRLDKKVFFDLLVKVIADLNDVSEVETAPKLEGRNVYAIIKSLKK